MLTALAPLAVLASEMPRAAAWPLALAAWLHGVRLFRHVRRSPPREFVFAGTSVTLDGEPVADAALHWRGPLAFVRWRDGDGRMRRLSWWPDTLPPARRRELRLAAPAPVAAPGSPSMAP